MGQRGAQRGVPLRVGQLGADRVGQGHATDLQATHGGIGQLGLGEAGGQYLRQAGRSVAVQQIGDDRIDIVVVGAVILHIDALQGERIGRDHLALAEVEEQRLQRHFHQHLVLVADRLDRHQPAVQRCGQHGGTGGAVEHRHRLVDQFQIGRRATLEPLRQGLVERDQATLFQHGVRMRRGRLHGSGISGIGKTGPIGLLRFVCRLHGHRPYGQAQGTGKQARKSARCALRP